MSGSRLRNFIIAILVHFTRSSCQGRQDLGSHFYPSLGIFFESLRALLLHALKPHAIRGRIKIVLVLLEESISKILLFVFADMSAAQLHLPFGRNACEAVLKEVDESFIILCAGCHLPTVHDQVAIRTNRTFILFQLWDLELVRNHDIRKKTEFSCIHKPIKIGPFDGSEPLSFLEKFFLYRFLPLPFPFVSERAYYAVFSTRKGNDEHGAREISLELREAQPLSLLVICISVLPCGCPMPTPLCCASCLSRRK